VTLVVLLYQLLVVYKVPSGFPRILASRLPILLYLILLLTSELL